MNRSNLVIAVGLILGIACGTSSYVGGSAPDGGAGGGNVPDAGSGSSGTGGDGGSCGSVVLRADHVPGKVVVVFDQSDSMSQAFGDAGPKWKVASAAVVAAVSALQDELEVGAVFQPTAGASGGVSSCPPVAPISQPPQIPITDGGDFLSEWTAHFQPPWTLLLGTPLGDALVQTNDALSSPSPGKTAVVVLTDGQPNCGETLSGILAPVQQMAERGIKTWVVGLPGASGVKVLMDIADAGGTGTYLLPSDNAALQGALAQITSNAIDQCTITLSPPPADPTQVHLVVTSASNGAVTQIAQNQPGGGWSISNGTTVTLLGSTCSTAEAGGYSQIEFDYGCVTIPFE